MCAIAFQTFSEQITCAPTELLKRELKSFILPDSSQELVDLSTQLLAIYRVFGLFSTRVKWRIKEDGAFFLPIHSVRQLLSSNTEKYTNQRLSFVHIRVSLDLKSIFHV